MGDREANNRMNAAGDSREPRVTALSENIVLSDVISACPVVVYASSVTGHFTPVHVSERARAMIVCDPMTFGDTPTRWFANIHTADALWVQSGLQQAAKYGRLTREYRLKHREGHDLWVAETLTPIQRDIGATFIIGVLRDISLRKQLEEELSHVNRQSDDPLAYQCINATDAESGIGASRQQSLLREREELYRITFNQAAMGIAHVNMSGRLLQVNQKFCDILGYSVDELMTTTFRELTHPDDLSGNIDVLNRVIRNEIQSFSAEKRYLHKSGHSVWCNLTSTVIRDEADKPKFFVSIIEDISWRKQAEAEMLNAIEAAESANRMKSSFLANMSHEIRTPMNGIIGMTELVLMSDLDAEQRDFLETVRTSAQSLLAIINDILDLSKVEAGKLLLVRAPFRISQLVSRVVRELELQAQQKHLALTYHPSKDIRDRVIGDEGRLRQVLTNLVQNAIKFTETGSVNISLDGEFVEHNETILHFSVADTGIGISLADQQQIFRPFEQADGSSTRTRGGTGLGLAISSRLVEMMGGRIWIESRLGHGSTFHFTVRLACQDSHAVPLVAESAEPDRRLITLNTDSDEFADVRILVAEDNKVNQKLMRNILTKLRCTPIIVDNGHDVLDALETQTFAIIFMDVQMPYMDGLMTTALIREKESLMGGHIPIVALTAHAMQGDRMKCLEVGMDDYMSKPIMPHELVAVLRRVLSPKPEQRIVLEPLAVGNEGG